jgi:TPR repeat protein
MRKLNKLVTIVVLILVVSNSSFADFIDGLVAYGKSDYKTAVNEWKPLAELGNAKAQINLGTMYFNGKGVSKDYKEAIKWYRKAAKQDNAYAQNSLGWMYDDGIGVIENNKEALKWYRKAATELRHSFPYPDPRAQYKIGVIYTDGKGVLKDLVKAKYWLKKAYENPTISDITKKDVEKAWNDFELWKY